MTTDKIDVLAVMLQSADALKYAGARRAGIDSVLEARAAVAELIAAAQSVAEADDGPDGVMIAHTDRLRAAIARVQGGAA